MFGFVICDKVIALCLQLDGSDIILNIELNHEFIENSDIVGASLPLVDSPKWNVKNVFKGGHAANIMDFAEIFSNWDSLCRPKIFFFKTFI